VKPYKDEIVTFRMMLQGYEQAVERFQAATTRPLDPSSAFAPLFEALNWAVALDDRTGEHWQPAGGPKPLKWEWRAKVEFGGYVSGIRFARNRVHHQWSDAFFLESVGPLEWVWRTADQLPGGRDDQGIDSYRTLLAGKPVWHALRVLTEVYEWIVVRLEPQSWTQPPRQPS
jgi:hypothetical protein